MLSCEPLYSGLMRFGLWKSLSVYFTRLLIRQIKKFHQHVMNISLELLEWHNLYQ